MKKLWIMSVFMLIAFGVMACGGDDEDNGDDTVATVDAIIIYSNQVSGGRGMRLQNLIQDADLGFEVEFVELTGQNLKSRLIAEKAFPIADVVLGGGILEHLELKEEGVTAPFFPSWLDLVDDMHKDEDGFYSPWAIEPLYMAYNKAHFTQDASRVGNGVRLAPTDWNDLADNFVDEYNVFKPSSGTGATIYASILSQYRDASGEHGISQEGWDALGKLINGGEVDRGLWQSNLAGDEKPIAMTWAGALIEIENAFGVELDVVRPEGGVPFVVSQVAVVDSGSQARMNTAEIFIEWWGQTETQVAWSEISGQAPANTEAFALVDEDVRRLTEADVMELDWQFIVDNVSAWRQKIELDLIGAH